MMTFTRTTLGGTAYRVLQFLVVDLILLPLVRACDPGFYPDPVMGDCYNCDDICHPKFDTFSQCMRTQECAGVLESGLKTLYKTVKDEVTVQPADAVTMTTCITQEPTPMLMDLQLTIGLAVGVSLLVICITTVCGFMFGRWWQKRKQNCKTKGPVAQEVGPTLAFYDDEMIGHGGSHGRLLPSGGSSTSTSANSTPTLNLRADSIGTHR